MIYDGRIINALVELICVCREEVRDSAVRDLIGVIVGAWPPEQSDIDSSIESSVAEVAEKIGGKRKLAQLAIRTLAALVKDGTVSMRILNDDIDVPLSPQRRDDYEFFEETDFFVGSGSDDPWVSFSIDGFDE